MPRAYKEYPPSYFSILERFEEDPTEMRIELPARDAFGRRRDFYRLGDVLSQIIQTDSICAPHPFNPPQPSILHPPPNCQG